MHSPEHAPDAQAALALKATIAETRRRLRMRGDHAGGAPSEAAANLPPPDADPLSESLSRPLWEGLVQHSSIADRGPAASADEAGTIQRLEELIFELLDAFSPFRRGILMSLLLGLTIGQTAERHRCTQRTVRATLQTAIELLAQSRLS